MEGQISVTGNSPITLEAPVYRNRKEMVLYSISVIQQDYLGDDQNDNPSTLTLKIFSDFKLFQSIRLYIVYESSLWKIAYDAYS